jgi:hypothetical protein
VWDCVWDHGISFSPPLPSPFSLDSSFCVTEADTNTDVELGRFRLQLRPLRLNSMASPSGHASPLGPYPFHRSINLHARFPSPVATDW